MVSLKVDAKVLLGLFIALCTAGIVSIQCEYSGRYNSAKSNALLSFQPEKGGSPKECFTAAVLEYGPENADDSSIKKNLEVYRQAAKLAASHGAQIIVYPEDGIIFDLKVQLQEIPDPDGLDSSNNNPCTHNYGKGSNNKILKKLSCIAREHNIYVVANFGTKQSCKPLANIGERTCPISGRLRLNTNVVLDPEGNFIKRYRKYNLFVEDFDRPPQLEIVHFDTPFGRFGILTCFDMLFKRPAIDLVERHQVDTMLYPTLWHDEIPILTGLQYQDGWSLAKKVNLVGANIVQPKSGAVGSGLYTQGNFIHTDTSLTQNSLVIASLEKSPSKSSKCMQRNEKLIIDLETKVPKQKYTYSNYILLDSDSIHALDQPEDKKTLCSKEVCCTLEYKLSPSSNDLKDRVILVVRDSLRQNPPIGLANWYEQVCLVATLKKPLNRENIASNRFDIKGQAAFEQLSLSGTFKTRHVFPIAGHKFNKLVERSKRDFGCDEELSNEGSHSCYLSYKGEPEDEKIYSFGLYGRLYELDEK